MIQAKELVNTFYQPLGHLNCQTSSKKMWEYSKERAIEWCDIFIKELDERRLWNVAAEFERLKEEISKC